MEKKNSLSLFVNQNLALLPELSLSLKILEMNNLDLCETLEKETLENPFLKYSAPVRYVDFDINTIAKPQNFCDGIWEEIAFKNFTEKEKEIVHILIYSITDEGYLDNSVLVNLRKKYNYQKLISVINRLKNLDSGHYFAFNLLEKIKIILQKEGNYNDSYEDFLLNIFMNKRNIDVQDKKYDLIKANVRKALRFIRNQNTEQEINRTVDLIVEYGEDNTIDLALSLDFLDIQLDTDLQLSMKEKARSATEKHYINEKCHEAKLLLRAINYRSSTLMKVAKEILFRQSDFFQRTSAYLIPLNVKTLAQSLNLHESTVHRAIRNKSISTPRGIFEMSELLVKEISSSNEGVVSDYSVKQYIKQLIRQEPHNSPYSDENIVYFLSTRGIAISRRTIAKYRESMNIPNSINRIKSYKIAE